MMNEYKERLEELERNLIADCEKYELDCSKCPHHAECEEYIELYHIVAEYNKLSGKGV